MEVSLPEGEAYEAVEKGWAAVLPRRYGEGKFKNGVDPCCFTCSFEIL